MSVSYKAVSWNRYKIRHDLILVGAIVVFLGLFVAIGLAIHPAATLPIQLMRASATAAFTLLHLILITGPLARLDPRWLPLLYNRRHLGVAMFLLALIHSLVAVIFYHSGTVGNPILSIFLTDAGPSMAAFPFQAFGFLALLILFAMAATSHDFWLANLTAPVWKALHMSVYLAYALLVVHIAFGALQSETHSSFSFLLFGGVLLVGGLHLWAGWRQAGSDREVRRSPAADGFVPVCAVADLRENQPLGAMVGGERIAVLRYEGNKVSVVSGVCQHQNGPLAEGRFIYGCLTCPWHGYQYHPGDGCSPAPFTEKIPTFAVRLENGIVWVHPRANPAGTPVAPALIPIETDPA